MKEVKPRYCHNCRYNNDCQVEDPDACPLDETDFSNKEKCISCGKQATKLCDIVTGIYYACGGNFDTGNTTCDKPICLKCSIHLNEHMDICPDCAKEIKRIGGSK